MDLGGAVEAKGAWWWLGCQEGQVGAQEREDQGRREQVGQGSGCFCVWGVRV